MSGTAPGYAFLPKGNNTESTTPQGTDEPAYRANPFQAPLACVSPFANNYTNPFQSPPANLSNLFGDISAAFSRYPKAYQPIPPESTSRIVNPPPTAIDLSKAFLSKPADGIREAAAEPKNPTEPSPNSSLFQSNPFMQLAPLQPAQYTFVRVAPISSYSQPWSSMSPLPIFNPMLNNTNLFAANTLAAFMRMDIEDRYDYPSSKAPLVRPATNNSLFANPTGDSQRDPPIESIDQYIEGPPEPPQLSSSQYLESELSERIKLRTDNPNIKALRAILTEKGNVVTEYLNPAVLYQNIYLTELRAKLESLRRTKNHLADTRAKLERKLRALREPIAYPFVPILNRRPPSYSPPPLEIYETLKPARYEHLSQRLNKLKNLMARRSQTTNSLGELIKETKCDEYELTAQSDLEVKRIIESQNRELNNIRSYFEEERKYLDKKKLKEQKGKSEDCELEHSAVNSAIRSESTGSAIRMEKASNAKGSNGNRIKLVALFIALAVMLRFGLVALFPSPV